MMNKFMTQIIVSASSLSICVYDRKLHSKCHLSIISVRLKILSTLTQRYQKQVGYLCLIQQIWKDAFYNI